MTLLYVNRCSGVMGKYAAGELKPPSTGMINFDNLIQNAVLSFFF